MEELNAPHLAKYIATHRCRWNNYKHEPNRQVVDARQKTISYITQELGDADP